MKNIINKIYILLFAIVAIGFNACVEPDDLVTSNVNTGGLVEATTGNVPYKLGATPSFDVSINVPAGPAISSVEVYKSFTTVGGVKSNSVLLTSIAIAGGNTSAEVPKTFTLTYADLKEGITVEGSPLPDSELDLSIGDSWKLEYTSVMTDDSRQVLNNASTNVSVANFFAGGYTSNVTYEHPVGMQIDHVDYKKDLLALNANKCETYMAGWTDVQLFITVNSDNTVLVESNEDDWDPLHNIAWGTNSYDPATGTIHIFYGYTRSNGTRMFEEKFTVR